MQTYCIFPATSRGRRRRSADDADAADAKKETEKTKNTAENLVISTGCSRWGAGGRVRKEAGFFFSGAGIQIRRQLI